MRLILQYSVSDGCTYSFTVTEPVVYESKEVLVTHLTELCKAKIKSPMTELHFINGQVSIDISDLIVNGKYYLPDILTIDEYFELNGH